MKTGLWGNALKDDNILSVYEALVTHSQQLLKFVELGWVTLPSSTVKDGYLFLAVGADRYLVVTPNQEIGYSTSLQIADFEAKLVPSELSNLANFFADLIYQAECLSQHNWAWIQTLLMREKTYCQIELVKDQTAVPQIGWLQCRIEGDSSKFSHPLFDPGVLGVRVTELNRNPREWGLKITRLIPPIKS